MNICTAFIAHPQPPVLRQPRQGPLDNPAVHTQPTAVGRPPFGQHRRNASRPQLLAVRLRIIGPVTIHPRGTAPRTPRLAADGGDRLQQRHQLGDIMAVSARHHSRQGNPLGIGQEMMLTAQFAPIGGVGAGFFPPRQPPGRSGYPPPPETNRACLPLGAWPARRHGGDAIHRTAANRADAASMSCRSHSPSPAAAFPTGAQTAAQRECPSTPHGRVPVADRLGVWGAWAAIREQ
jgi:hypothetical protein